MSLNVIPKPNTVEYHGGYVWLDENEVTYKTNEHYPDEYYCIEITRGKTIITTKNYGGDKKQSVGVVLAVNGEE